MTSLSMLDRKTLEHATAMSRAQLNEAKDILRQAGINIQSPGEFALAAATIALSIATNTATIEAKAQAN